MLYIGDYAYDIVARQKVQILKRIEMWDYVSYKVFNLETSCVYKLSEEQLDTDTNSRLYDENYLRYVVQLSKIKNVISSGFLSTAKSDIIPLPHQLHVLNRVMNSKKIRYILADEVGLGKTIEAGMIIKELKARGLVDRVLVVCPTGLVSQWESEMSEKFHEKFNVILPSDYDTIKRLSGKDDVYGQFNQVISPMDSIKPIERHVGWTEENIQKYNEDRIYSIINSGWDLIIIDEAHRVAGSSGEVARYKLGKLLSEASPYLLLLSATPHNGKTEPFLRLVRLLDDEAFPNVKSIVKEQVAPYLIRTEKREAIDNNGNKLFKNRVTHLVELNWDSRHTLQRELYTCISLYVSKSYNKALRNKKKNMCFIFLLIIMQRMVTSSTAAIRDSLQKRLNVLLTQNTQLNSVTEDDIANIDIEDNAEEALKAASLNIKDEIDELQKLIELTKQAEFQYTDVKVEKLTELIDSIICNNSKQKIIVFTEFVATQKYLQSLLIKKGYSVTVLNGSMSIEERNDALKEFRDRNNIFISTDAGGEGLNLQFSNIIINYDLPWNPMKIEQRCGRVDRIGQQNDVHIYNFIIKDTVENRVRQVLEEKLSIILKEMGIDKYSDVLDSEATDYDFTKVYMNSIGKPKNSEINIYQVEDDLKQELSNAKKYKDIIKEEKDLNQLVGKVSDFDVDKALNLMLFYYKRWLGGDWRMTDGLSINDEETAKFLKKDIVQDRTSSILSVGINNFPNEAGYFMLWELEINEESNGKRIIPIFVNDNFVLRPMAGRRIMDVFSDSNSSLVVKTASNISDEIYERLNEISKEFAFDTFIELRDKQIKANEENYKKYMYALELRKEAAGHIGIDNIRRSRIEKLEEEKKKIETDYKNSQYIFPDFRLIILVRLEA